MYGQVLRFELGVGRVKFEDFRWRGTYSRLGSAVIKDGSLDPWD